MGLIEVDADLLREVMRRYGLGTEREAVDMALRCLVRLPPSRESLLGLEGLGWEGDLDAMRESSTDRSPTA